MDAMYNWNPETVRSLIKCHLDSAIGSALAKPHGSNMIERVRHFSPTLASSPIPLIVTDLTAQ